jgi:hypothetical protein
MIEFLGVIGEVCRKIKRSFLDFTIYLQMKNTMIKKIQIVCSETKCIESFWAYAKLGLAKLKGIPVHTFELHLKETEFRFNHRHENL